MQFNDGTPVPPGLFAQTYRDLLHQFGGVTIEPQSIQGKWLREGLEYEDQLVRALIDVPDTDDSVEFFVKFKETLKERFQQVEVWITSYSIDRT